MAAAKRKMEEMVSFMVTDLIWWFVVLVMMVLKRFECGDVDLSAGCFC